MDAMTPEQRREVEAEDQALATTAEEIVAALVTTFGRGAILEAMARQADRRERSLRSEAPQVADVHKWWSGKLRGVRREYYEMRTKK